METCPDCNGTGRDDARTAEYQKTADFEMQGGYIACRSCHGNGLEVPYPDYSNHRKPISAPSREGRSAQWRRRNSRRRQRCRA